MPAKPASKPSLAARCPTPLRRSLRTRDERLDALKLLSGKLAHDFNNFLAPVLGYTALIKEDADPDSTVTSYANALDHSARATGELLDETLAATRPKGRIRRVPGDLAGLLRERVDEWRRALHPTARIEIRTELEPAEFSFDPDVCRQAVDHLLSNARLALATGGTLRVSLNRVTLDASAAAELGVIGVEQFHLSVADSGFGMEPEVLEKAFDPFFTTRPKTHGRGLGLTLVHSLARSHGGQVALSSEPDRGTTVDLWFPVDPDGAQQETPPSTSTATDPARADNAATGCNTILIVDDDPWIVEVVRTFLEREGFTVLAADDGTKGLRLFQRRSDEIGLVLSDVSMPNLNGIEMAVELRKQRPDLPVLFMSGAPETLEDEKVFFQVASPAQQLIRKPFALRELIACVRALTSR